MVTILFWRSNALCTYQLTCYSKIYSIGFSLLESFSVTQTMKEAFDEFGFVIVKNIFSSKEVEILVNLFEFVWQKNQEQIFLGR
jgi:hypothetical protein